MSRPSGEQYEIVAGSTSATITEVGATLRCLRVAGRDIVWGFPEDETCSAGRGQVLAPWPNRLANGSYSFAGRVGKAAIDEPAHNNAIHGLVRWLPWQMARRGASSVVGACRLAPQPAYPWWLRLEVSYSVAPGELTVEVMAENPGGDLAPFAVGFHPYLAASSAGLQAAILQVPAARRLLVDANQLPVASQSLRESQFAGLAEGLALDGVVLDDAFTDLADGSDGCWRVQFTPDEEQSPVVLWADAVFTHVMCFTGDTLAAGDRRRGIAIEPMTAPPNAFVSGDGVLSLSLRPQFVARWGIALG